LAKGEKMVKLKKCSVKKQKVKLFLFFLKERHFRRNGE